MTIITREPTPEELSQITADLAAHNAATGQSLTVEQYYAAIVEGDFNERKKRKIASARDLLVSGVTALPDERRQEWTAGAFALYQQIASRS